AEQWLQDRAARVVAPGDGVGAGFVDAKGVGVARIEGVAAETERGGLTVFEGVHLQQPTRAPPDGRVDGAVYLTVFHAEVPEVANVVGFHFYRHGRVAAESAAVGQAQGEGRVDRPRGAEGFGDGEIGARAVGGFAPFSRAE